MSGNDFQIPSEDLKMAVENRLLFKVVTKAGKGKRWERVGEDTHSLEEAIGQASSISAYQSGVFVVTRNGSFIYWTSDEPDLYNSTVLNFAARWAAEEP